MPKVTGLTPLSCGGEGMTAHTNLAEVDADRDRAFPLTTTGTAPFGAGCSAIENWGAPCSAGAGASEWTAGPDGLGRPTRSTVKLQPTVVPNIRQAG